MNKEFLEGLSIDDKRAVVKLLKKKERAKQESKIDEFVPNPGVQEDFLKSNSRIRAMFAGNAVGKTTSMVIEMLWQHLGIHPYRDTTNTHHTWLLIPSASKAEDYVMEIKKWCPPSLVPDTDRMGTSDIRRLRWKNGTITTIYTFEQESGKLEGTNISGLFMDECAPRSHYLAAYRGLRANENYFICIAATPISSPWMYEELYVPWMTGADSTIQIFEGSSYENKHVPLEWIKDFESRLTEEEREVRIHGKFAVLQGRVYKQFSKDNHVIATQDWPQDWPVYCAIDPHPKKPHAVLWVGVTPSDNYVVIDEHSEKGELSDLAEAVLAKSKNRSLAGIYIDNSGAALDWSRTSAVETLAKYGVYASPVGRSDKDLDSGINRIKELLKGVKNKKTESWEPRIKVMAHCRKLITEFEMYSWKEPKNAEIVGDSEKPKKVYDEFLDCLRYIVNKTPEYQTEIQEFYSYDREKTPYNVRVGA